MKEYRGWRTAFGVAKVKVHGDPTLKRPWYLRPRLDLIHYTPDDFDWGDLSLAAGQLSLALLADHFGHIDDERAMHLHQEFLKAYVSKLPLSGWVITSDDIDLALATVYEEKLEE
jgi:hypothetical protein